MPANEAQRNQQLARQQIRDDLRAVVSTPVGRRWVWWLIHSRCKYGLRCFTGNSTSFYNEGAHDVGRDVRETWAEVSLDTLHQAEREHPRRDEETERQKRIHESGNSNAEE